MDPKKAAVDRALRFTAEPVAVGAKVTPATRWPKAEELIRILLGSQTEKPLGTYTGERSPLLPPITPEFLPWEREQIAEIQRKYPHAFFNVMKIKRHSLPRISGGAGQPDLITGAQWDPNQEDITFDTGYFTQPSLGHELAHAAQSRAFVSGKSKPERDYTQERWFKGEYWDQLGEQQARALERALAGQDPNPAPANTVKIVGSKRMQ